MREARYSSRKRRTSEVVGFFDSTKGMPNRSARFLRFSSSGSVLGATVGGGVADLVGSCCLDSFGASGGAMTG